MANDGVVTVAWRSAGCGGASFGCGCNGCGGGSGGGSGRDGSGTSPPSSSPSSPYSSSPSSPSSCSSSSLRPLARGKGIWWGCGKGGSCASRASKRESISMAVACAPVAQRYLEYA